MRELYACQLLLRDEVSPPADILDRCSELVRQWIGRPSGLTPENLWHGQHETASGHRLTAHTHAPTGDGPSGWQCSWEFPGADDSSVGWMIDVALAEQSSGVCATVRIGIQQAGQDFQLDRPAYQFAAPAIVRTFLRTFHAADAGRPLGTGYTPVRVADIPDLVSLLTDEQRALPVVAVTNDPATGRPLVNLEALARELSGLAHVVVVTTHLASQALTARIGGARSLWQGAARLYWPRFTVDDDPYKHRLWSPARMRQLGDGFTGELLRWLGSASAARVPENPVFEWIRQAQYQEISESEKLSQEAKQSLDRLQAELRRLRDERDEAKRDLASARAEVQRLGEQFALVAQYTKGGPEQVDPADNAADVDLTGRSIVDVYELAKSRIGDDLVLLPNADESIAKFTAYKQPEKLYRALLDVAEASRRWGDGSLGKTIGQFFNDCGYSYGANNPAATARKTKRHYQAKYNDSVVTLTAHLKVDESTTIDQCLRIYWYLDEEQKIFVVGHVGRHLPD